MQNSRPWKAWTGVLVFSHLLECVPQTELELPLRSIGVALLGNLAKRPAGRIVVWIIQVGVVEVVEGFCLEDQLMILVARNDVEALLQRRAGAVEAGAKDQATHSPRGKGSKRCR